MIDKVRNIMLKYNLITKDDNILIGLSGGPDSVCLFHILRLLKEVLRFNLYASHINHMYRGIDAEKDEKFVKDLCAKYNIKLFILKKNAVDYASEHKITEEEAGREIRYNFFKSNLSNLDNGKIAVAHNINDQAETVLQRIIRGTGIDGLKGMAFKNGNVIRPILNVSRKEIEDFLHDNNFEYCIDKTNNMPIYGRNKIRLELIPFLEEKYNPNIQKTLVRMAENAAKDSKIIKKYINEIFKNVLEEKKSGLITLNISNINRYEEFEITRIIRKAIYEIKGDNNNIESKHINYIIKLLKDNKTGKKINLPEKIFAEISYNSLIIGKTIEKIKEFEYNIIINGKTNIKEINKRVVTKIRENLKIPKNHKSIFLDYNKVSGNIIARNRRIGDIMIPKGMKGTKKVKDIFIDSKVPKGERDKKIILTDNKNIIWVEGFREDNRYKVTKETKKFIEIRILEDKVLKNIIPK